DAAAGVVKAFAALLIPEPRVFFALALPVLLLAAPLCLAHAAAVGLRLAAVGSVVAKPTRTVLPADRANTVVAGFAFRIAERAVLFFAGGAAHRSSGAATVALLFLDLHRLAAGGAVILVAGWAFLPTDGALAVVSGAAVFVAQQAVLLRARPTLRKASAARRDALGSPAGGNDIGIARSVG